MFRSISSRVRWAALAALCVAAIAPVPARGVEGSAIRALSDSADAAQAATRFHAALASGDSASALRLLAPDARIIESGAIEDREEYRRHHLPADIRFAQGVAGRRTIVSVVVTGDVAWVSSTSEAKGTLNGRAVNSIGAELMVLTRDPHAAHAGSQDAPRWIIRAIHWSSRRGKA